MNSYNGVKIKVLLLTCHGCQVFKVFIVCENRKNKNHNAINFNLFSILSKLQTTCYCSIQVVSSFFLFCDQTNCQTSQNLLTERHFEQYQENQEAMGSTRHIIYIYTINCCLKCTTGNMRSIWILCVNTTFCVEITRSYKNTTFL